MTKSDDRLTELEIEVADLRAQLADLTRSAPVPPAEPPRPRTVVEEGATVTYLPSTNARFVMASSGELDQLLAIVCRRFPILRKGISTGRFASQDEVDFRSEFEAAFRALGSINRMADGVDAKHGTDRWVRAVQDRMQGGSTAMHVLPFTAAAVAHGDILFQLNFGWMTSSSFGLRDDGMGIAATDKWRVVLSSNTTRDSLPLPLPTRTWRMGDVRAG